MYTHCDRRNLPQELDMCLCVKHRCPGGNEVKENFSRLSCFKHHVRTYLIFDRSFNRDGQNKPE